MGIRIGLEPRLVAPGRALSLGLPAAGLLLAFALGSLLLLATGYNPLTAFSALWRGAAGSQSALFNLANKTVPILLCAAGISIAIRARLWNIGAEGQIYMGALFATGVGLNLPQAVPQLAGVPLVLIAGAIGGLLLAAIPALLKALLDVSEILTTLMLNYVAILLVGFLVSGPWADPMTFGMPYTPLLPSAAMMPKLFGTIHIGVLLALAAFLFLLFMESRTRFGYQLRIFGDAPRAALYGGISARGLILSSLMLAGLFAGVAGALEVTGATGRLQEGLSPGYGFIAVMVAALARARAVPVLLCSILYAGLLNGGFSLQVSGIPPAIATLLQATIMICVLGATTLNGYRVRIVRTAPAPKVTA